jgi:DNA ligase (NAD+)
MSIFDIKDRMDALVQEFQQHNINYYVLAMPTISDYEFDQKLKELESLEKAHPEFINPNSPTLKVGGEITKNFETVIHKWPMMSLGNTYNQQDLIDFDQRVRKAIGEDFEYVCELKFDGLSISLTYENGKLLRAVTRGDGSKGDDVTNNVKTIRTVPIKVEGKNMPSYFDIRGEVLMHKAAFERLNEERIENGEVPFANPRNFASGTIKTSFRLFFILFV